MKCFVYVVKAGESLSVIGGRYGITASELAALNGIVDPNVIYEGQELWIPYPAE